MANKLAEIQKKLRERAEQHNNSNQDNQGPRKLFAHWNDTTLPIGEQARIRFLPDGNQDNIFFWREKHEIELTFPGVEGNPSLGDVRMRVPCMETWPGETCPILADVRPWWKGDADDKSLASKYWKKYSYYLQGFVCELSEGVNETPENPIRIFKVNKKIYESIQSSVMDGDFEESPDDYVNGTDFLIKKNQVGAYKNYDASTWVRRERALDEAELKAIEDYGLFNLEEEIGRKPTPEEVDAIYALFAASLNGELYNPAEFAWLPWRPYGVDYVARGQQPTQQAEAQAAEPKVEEPAQQPQAQADAPSTSSDDIDAILARVRANQSK